MLLVLVQGQCDWWPAGNPSSGRLTIRRTSIVSISCGTHQSDVLGGGNKRKRSSSESVSDDAAEGALSECCDALQVQSSCYLRHKSSCLSWTSASCLVPMFVLRLGSPCESVLGWWLQSSKEADPQRLGRSSEVAAPCSRSAHWCKEYARCRKSSKIRDSGNQKSSLAWKMHLQVWL